MKIDYSYKDEALLMVLLNPRKGVEMKPQLFLLEAIRLEPQSSAWFNNRGVIFREMRQQVGVPLPVQPGA